MLAGTWTRADTAAIAPDRSILVFLVRLQVRTVHRLSIVCPVLGSRTPGDSWGLHFPQDGTQSSDKRDAILAIFFNTDTSQLSRSLSEVGCEVVRARKRSTPYQQYPHPSTIHLLLHHHLHHHIQPQYLAAITGPSGATVMWEGRKS